MSIRESWHQHPYAFALMAWALSWLVCAYMEWRARFSEAAETTSALLFFAMIASVIAAVYVLLA